MGISTNTDDNRNSSVDFIRGISLLTILTYHFCGGTFPKLTAASWCGLLEYLVQIAMTMFFVISGYGIFCSLDKAHGSGTYSYKAFIEKRLQRLAPPYYIALILMLVVGNGAYYLSRKHALNIISHFTFVHSFSPSFSGTIIGSAWFLSTIFTLYLIAPSLYNLLKKNTVLFMAGSFAISVLAKYLLLHYAAPALVERNGGGWYNFWLARILFVSVLDNFTAGMAVAFVIGKRKLRINPIAAFLLLLSSAVMFAVLYWNGGFLNYIWRDNLLGYLFHTILCAICAVFLYAASSFRLGTTAFIPGIVLWISEYEYEIYLLHFEIASNIMEKSSLFNRLADVNKLACIAFLILAAVSFGVILKKLSQNIRMKYKYTFISFITIYALTLIICIDYL